MTEILWTERFANWEYYENADDFFPGSKRQCYPSWTQKIEVVLMTYLAFNITLIQY